MKEHSLVKCWIQRVLCSNLPCSLSHTQTPPRVSPPPPYLSVLPSTPHMCTHAPPFSMMEAQGLYIQPRPGTGRSWMPHLRFGVVSARAQGPARQRAPAKVLPQEPNFRELVLTSYFTEAGSLLMFSCSALQTLWAVSGPPIRPSHCRTAVITDACLYSQIPF